MPEGDTVWRAARTLHKALAGARVTTDFRVPQLATTELVGTVTESASRGKHLLTRFDHRRHPPHAPEDGGLLAPVPTGRGLASSGTEARVVLHRRSGPRSGSPSAWSSSCAPTPRTPWSATWVPTCSGLTGTRRGRAPARPDPPARSPMHCSTSATWPASATSTRASSASWPATTRAPRSGPSTTSTGSSTAPTACCSSTATASSRRPRATSAAAGSTGSTAATGSHAGAAAPGSSSTNRVPRVRGGRPFVSDLPALTMTP